LRCVIWWEVPIDSLIANKVISFHTH
jgi:hypothetical protein